MKISKTQLKQIIKEELGKVLNELEWQDITGAAAIAGRALTGQKQPHKKFLEFWQWLTMKYSQSLNKLNDDIRGPHKFWLVGLEGLADALPHVEFTYQKLYKDEFPKVLGAPKHGEIQQVGRTVQKGISAVLATWKEHADMWERKGVGGPDKGRVKEFNKRAREVMREHGDNIARTLERYR